MPTIDNGVKAKKRALRASLEKYTRRQLVELHRKRVHETNFKNGLNRNGFPIHGLPKKEETLA